MDKMFYFCCFAFLYFSYQVVAMANNPPNEVNCYINNPNVYLYKNVTVYEGRMRIADGCYLISDDIIRTEDVFYKPVILSHEYCHHLQYIQNRSLDEIECSFYCLNPLNW
jgi:hypothetical protein